MIWFTSDTHFNHLMVAQVRGFETAEKHDETIIANWNSVVMPDDTVWHLGDVGLGRWSTLRPKVCELNGLKHLITGNHDATFPGARDSHKHQLEWMDTFLSVQAYARRRICDEQVLLSHFPYTGDHSEEDRYTQYRLRDEGLYLLHGHTHSWKKLALPSFRVNILGGEPQRRGRMIHVGLDAWDFKPVSLSVIEKMIRKDVAHG